MTTTTRPTFCADDLLTPEQSVTVRAAQARESAERDAYWAESPMRLVATTHTHDRVTPRRHALATRLLELAASVQGYVKLYGKGFLVYGVSVELLACMPGVQVGDTVRDGSVFVFPALRGE